MKPNKKSKYILDIVPLTKILLTRNQSFSYLHENELPEGTLVSIPFSGRKIEGVVLGSKKDFPRLGGMVLKKIDKVVEENFLTKKQLELAQFISDYYISPLGVVMKNFVPKQIRRKKNEERRKKRLNKEIILTKKQQLAVTEITSCFLLPASYFLLFGPSGSGKTEVYIHSILKLREKDESLQFLILVPEKTLTPQAVERYGEYFSPEEMAVMSSNISAGEFFKNWNRVKSGEVKIIIATRKGVFSPFKKLGLIVIDEEQDMSYKQWDMNPRYDARICAEKLGELHGCPVVRGTATPSVESYYRAINNNLGLLKLPVLNLGEERRKKQEASGGGKTPASCFLLPASFEIVDMRKERWAKNYSCVSKKLKSEIAYALKYKQQIILLINRQGMSSFSVCDSCKTVLKCPKCERALVYDNSGSYRCVHCSHQTSITPECAKCKGITFKNVGLGTQKVEKEISSLFPGARVERIDSQAIKNANFQSRVFEEFTEGKIDVLIGTQMISKGWDLPRVSLVGIIDADNMLSIPDFRSQEKAYQLMAQVAGRTGRPGAKFPGVVVLQTYQPESKIMRWVAERNFEAFFENEIEERKMFGFPPFGRIAKLVFQDYSRKRTAAETGRAYDSLEKIKNIEVSEPQDSFVSNIRGRNRRQIIIKFKDLMPADFTRELKKLGQGWIIDVDPVSII